MTRMPEETSRFSYSGRELDALASATNYYDAILDHFAGHVGQRVVEVGAGIGTFAEALRLRTGPSEMVLIEPATNNFPALRDRFGEDPHTQLIQGYLEDHAGSLS